MFALNRFWAWTSGVFTTGRWKLCLEDREFGAVTLSDSQLAAVTLSDSQLAAVLLSDEVPQCE